MYWWQEESRKKRVRRLLTQLAVDLGRLPTFEEAVASDEMLVHDAAVCYGSFSNLRELVASALYSSHLRTYPTEDVKLYGRVSRDDPAELQVKYEERLREMGLEPKDPKRLIEPAPLPELRASASVKKSSALTRVTEKLAPWDGRRADDFKGSDELDRETLQEVVEQAISQVAEETIKVVLAVEEADKSEKEVKVMARCVSRETCIEAVRQVYAALGEKAWKQLEYASYASANGLPAVSTMIKNLGKQKTWRQYLEDVAQTDDADAVVEGAVCADEVADVTEDAEEQVEQRASDIENVEEASEASRLSEVEPTVSEAVEDVEKDVIEIVMPSQIELQVKLYGRPIKVVIKSANT